MHLILFYIFGGLALAAGINLLIQRHPIHSALSLVGVMGALAVLYLLLGAEFIAFIQIIVYAGAIMVLFVFVIAVLNAEAVPAGRSGVAVLAVGIPAFLSLGALLSVLLYHHFHAAPTTFGAPIFSARAIGEVLFHRYLLPFEVTSVLFLVGLLGAVLLAGRREEEKPARMPEHHKEAGA